MRFFFRKKSGKTERKGERQQHLCKEKREKKVVIKTERGKTVPNEGKENDKRKKKKKKRSEDYRNNVQKQNWSNEKN